MDYSRLFYWLTVADNAKLFFGIMAIFFTAVFIITQFVRVGTFLDADGDVSEDFTTKMNKWTWYSTPFMLLFLSLWIFTPNKKDALLIVAGGQTLNFLTNDESAKEIPSELTSFVLTELKHMAKEAEVELNISEQKDKIIKRAKNMTAEELIKEMKMDSTFTNIILQNK